ncbi:MAG: hypothetical protein ACXWLT_13765, partial [Rhizomicrobium sp.]
MAAVVEAPETAQEQALRVRRAEWNQAGRFAASWRSAEQPAGFLFLKTGQLGGLVVGRQMVRPLEQGLQVGRNLGRQPEAQ